MCEWSIDNTLSAISIVISMILTGASVVIAKVANDLTKKSDRMRFRQDIEGRFANVRQSFLILKESDYGKNASNSPSQLERVFVQNMLCCFEDICKKYFDEQNDKDWFRVNFAQDVKDIVEYHAIKNEYVPGTKYEATLKCYNALCQTK